ncbi:phospholipase B1, membrane-associated-like, partial [Clarias magur]
MGNSPGLVLTLLQAHANPPQKSVAESGWKLLIIFVPVDRQCMCSQQENLKDTLREKDWYSRDDFTVQLQDVPLFSNVFSNNHKWTSEEKLNDDQAYTVFLQLWENLLQPITNQENLNKGDDSTIRCPTKAGNGVPSTSLLDVLTQYRGLSWSIGGDNNISTVTTLPNILRVFNPELTGFSVKTGKQTTKQAFLNQAVAGAKSIDLLNQAKVLVNRMKTDN